MRFPPSAPYAYFSGLLATGLEEVARSPEALDRPGWWAVVGTFEGEWTCARFADMRPAPLPKGHWRGPHPEDWHSSLDQPAYESAVSTIRERIAAGDVYQANLCRILRAPIPPDDDPAGLAQRLAYGNPAPYAGIVDLPDLGVRVVTASPELYLSRVGDVVTSSPIKGTGRTEADLLPKDFAENVMIVDLVRNDLSRVARPGSVTVPDLCVVEKHPGLVHLVSTVRAHLSPGTSWSELLEAAFPPGSVSGAPKLSALDIIGGLEAAPRGPYCGAVGWVDAERRTAELAVGIRTFWIEQDELKFGTGAGITWGSDPGGEWRETELKAARLVALASAPDAPASTITTASTTTRTIGGAE
jgi:para-aminobenzoate synthetase component 1